MSYKKNLLFFIILVFPAIFFRFFTSIYPNISTLYLSLTDTNLMDGTSNFIGLKNYFRLYYNKNNLIILNFTLLFVFSSLFFQLTFGFLISLLLNRESKIKNTLRTFSLLPWALPMIVVAYAFHWMLDDQFGLISIFYSFVDEKPLIFLDPLYSKITVILINIWKTMPFVAIVFLAGLQGIQKEVIDAAKVDGASNINIALKEAYRVLKPGGRFLCLEFSKVKNEILNKFYKVYSKSIPKLGKFVIGKSEPYEYLINSIEKFYSQEELFIKIKKQNFTNISYRNLNSGIVAIHSAWKI